MMRGTGRAYFKRSVAFVLVGLLFLTGITVPSTQKVYADASDEWIGLVDAAVTKGNEPNVEVIGAGATVSFEDTLTVNYQIAIGSRNINTNDINPALQYMLGELDNQLSDAALIALATGDGIPIRLDPDDINSPLVGTVHYAEGTRALYFQFDADLSTKAPDSILTDFSFNYTVELDKTAIGDAKEAAVSFTGDSSAAVTIKIKENQPAVPTISKSDGEYEADNRIKWVVTVTSNGIAYPNGFTISDTFSDGLSYDASRGVAPGGTVTEFGSVTDIEANRNHLEFKYTPPSSDDFSVKGKTYTFTYYTGISDKILVGGNAGMAANGTSSDSTVNNSVVVKDSETGEPIGSADANATVPVSLKPWINKSADGGLVYHETENKATIKWNIEIELNGFYTHMNELYLHDQLDYPLNYVAGSVTYTLSGKNASNVDATCSSPALSGFTFTTSTLTEKATLAGPGDTGFDLKAAINAAIAAGPVENPEKLTIEYESVITDYANYLKMNRKTPENRAWLSWKWNNYDGYGGTTDLTGPVLTKSSGAESTMITKTGAYDTKSQLIIWTVSFNQNGITLPETVTVKDILSAGHTYVPNSEDITPSGSGVVVNGPSSPVNGDADTEADRTVTFTFSGEIKDLVTFTYQTKVNDVNIYAQNASQRYSNEAILYAGGNEYDKATAEIEYRSVVLEKTAGSYDYATKEIPWTVTVNKNKMPMTNIVVTDKIPKGTSLVTPGLVYKLYENETFLTTPITTINTDGLYYAYTASSDTADGTLTIHLPDLLEGQYGVIEYRTTVDVNSGAFAGSFRDTNEPVAITNGVELQNQYPVTNLPHVDKTVSIPTKLIAKSGTVLDRSTISYTVPLNASGATLPVNYTIRDTLSAWMTYAPSTVKIYEGNVNASTGEVTKSSPSAVLVSGVDYSVHFSTDSSGNAEMTITLLKATNKALVLEYWVAVDTSDATATTYTNRVMVGSGSTPATGNSSIGRSLIFSSSGTGGLRSAGSIRLEITKRDVDTSNPLSGAVFDLYEADGTTLVGRATTNSAGTLIYYGLKGNTDYILREVTAPAGYKLNTADISVSTLGSGAVSVPVTNKTKAGVLTFQKINTSSQPLAGAVFGIWSVTDETDSLPTRFPDETATSNASGSVVFEGLMNSSASYYKITEISAPKGYVKTDKVYTCAVDTTGKVTAFYMDGDTDKTTVISIVNQKAPVTTGGKTTEDPSSSTSSSTSSDDSSASFLFDKIDPEAVKSSSLPKTGGFVGSVSLFLLGASMVVSGIYLDKRGKKR